MPKSCGSTALYYYPAISCFSCTLLRPSKFEGHCPMIRHGCRMALMAALNWSVECVKEES
ncbi:MAG: hypothetical protein BECKG1743F_GA0114225_103281 [Candidatus Kentron sp. G]|nr:MAG: hypothetical protein BECKG1743F_GA0114225_103281 [Candidatus Kentron sp. G]